MHDKEPELTGSIHLDEEAVKPTFTIEDFRYIVKDLADPNTQWRIDRREGEMLLAEIDNLQARYKRLLDAVVILPRDAEPEIGDVYYSPEGYYGRILSVDEGTVTINCAKRHNDKEHYCALKGGKIIQRAGKPVVYQTVALKEGFVCLAIEISKRIKC